MASPGFQQIPAAQSIGCADLNDSQLTGIHFASEQDFEKGVDRLFSKKRSFVAVGFDVLLVPTQEYEASAEILKAAELSFKRVAVIPTSELTAAQREILREEQDQTRSFGGDTKKDR